jgi:hypothetical protein
MKTFVAVLALVGVIGSVLLASSGGKTPSDNRLTVEQLAQLMDFHAWSFPIPPSLQPAKKVRLLIIRPDGTEALKWQTGELGSGTSIYLGFRVEEGVFKGRFHIRDSKGQDEGRLFKFKDDEFTNIGTNGGSVGFVTTGEAPEWKGNRAQLGSSVKIGEKGDSIFVLELVK